MSPEAVAAERVYRGLKRVILEGQFAPGTMLVVTTIAREFGTSIAPVRDSMQRLVGERLLDLHIGGGFQMPRLTADGLAHLYLWHQDLIKLALKFRRSGTSSSDYQPAFSLINDDDTHALAEATAELFVHIAGFSGNPEHVEAVRSVGERLHATRIRETGLSNRLRELERIWALAGSGPSRDAQEAIRRYHRRRLRQVSRLVPSEEQS